MAYTPAKESRNIENVPKSFRGMKDFNLSSAAPEWRENRSPAKFSSLPVQYPEIVHGELVGVGGDQYHHQFTRLISTRRPSLFLWTKVEGARRNLGPIHEDKAMNLSKWNGAPMSGKSGESWNQYATNIISAWPGKTGKFRNTRSSERCAKTSNALLNAPRQLSLLELAKKSLSNKIYLLKINSAGINFRLRERTG